MAQSGVLMVPRKEKLSHRLPSPGRGQFLCHSSSNCERLTPDDVHAVVVCCRRRRRVVNVPATRGE